MNRFEQIMNGGKQAFDDCKSKQDCPHHDVDDKAAWELGYMEAEEDFVLNGCDDD